MVILIVIIIIIIIVVIMQNGFEVQLFNELRLFIFSWYVTK